MNVQVRKAIAEDILRLQDCLDADEFHKGQKAELWQDLGTLIAFHDARPLYYVCIQREGSKWRIHFQQDTAPGRQLIVSMAQGIEWLKREAKKEGTTALVFESTAPALIKFFSKFGFEHVTENDYEVRL